MSHLNDEVLAGRAAAGNLSCFEELVQRYKDRVYRICYRSAGNPEDAEDWAQECLVRVYRQLGRYDVSYPFAPWLLKVVTNTCINLARTRARRQEHVVLGLLEDGDALTGSTREDTLCMTLSVETEREILSAVESLPPLLRQAVVLRVVEDLSFREVADVLGVPLQTAATRVRRALAQIREHLARRGMGVSE